MAIPKEQQPTPRRDSPLLEICGLGVEYRSRDQHPVLALDTVDLELAAGEALGVLGESGCGKTTLALTIPGLLPTTGHITRGTIRFQGQRLDGFDDASLEAIRGDRIAIIHQDPALALHPLKRVGGQIAEVLRAHRPWPKTQRQEATQALLGDVGFDDVNGITAAYPHQLSGGQRQRIVIAQALACQPDLIIADELTAALDTASQARLLALLSDLGRRRGVAYLLISHDPDVIAEVAERVVVMYAGQVVEDGPVDEVLQRPRHPYTEALLRCRPPLQHRPPSTSSAADRQLPAIPGRVPTATDMPQGCRFAPRCSYRQPACDERLPDLLTPQSITPEDPAPRAVRCVRDLA